MKLDVGIAHARAAANEPAGLEVIARPQAILGEDPAQADECPAQRSRLRTLQDRFGDPPDEYHYRGALVNWLAVAGRCAEALALGERVLRVLSERPLQNHRLCLSRYQDRVG